MLTNQSWHVPEKDSVFSALDILCNLHGDSDLRWGGTHRSSCFRSLAGTCQWVVADARKNWRKLKWKRCFCLSDTHWWYCWVVGFWMLSFTVDERANGLWRRPAGGPHQQPPPPPPPRVCDYDAFWFILQDLSICPTRKRSEMMRLLAMFEDHHGKEMVGLKGMSGITQVVCHHDQALHETKDAGSFWQLSAFSGDTAAILGSGVSSVESLTAAGSWTVESAYQLVVAATRNRSQSVTPLKPSLYFATNRGCLGGCALSICWELSFELDE